jgi:glucuronate isomerase
MIMKAFMDDEFLLETGTARELFHEGAEYEPIFDYHCHLNPAQIAENKRFANLTEMWLEGDHYKWRMMRAMGIDESLITGKAPDYEKFLAWAGTVENLIGNPLYHWTHLELQRYFGITEPLTTKSAHKIWEQANAALAGLSVRDILAKFRVYAVGTTDDPVDSLEHHRAIAAGTAAIGKIDTKVIPSFRPDKALGINLKDFPAYIEKLAAASGTAIRSVEDLLNALEKRLDFFVGLGCRASDHGMEYPPFVAAPDEDVEAVFKDALTGRIPTPAMTDAFKTKVLTGLAGFYAKRGMVMQLHMAAIRNVNSRMLQRLGPDTGYDAVVDNAISAKLAGLLDHMDKADSLPKTVLYSLNPKDYYPLVTVMGGFQDGGAKQENHPGVRGRMQFGSAWWFCDHRDGMEEQLRVLASTGLLPAFVGMLTDSRSFLSYPRHEYFRRILCNLIGNWVENGEYPRDTEKLLEMVRAIAFENARQFFV